MTCWRVGLGNLLAGLAWSGLARSGLARSGLAWSGLAWLGLGASACTGLVHCAHSKALDPLPVPASNFDPSRPKPVFALAQDNDYVVRIVSGEVTCSGTLVDNALVLTAHHCVSARDSKGDFLSRDAASRNIRIELGGDYLPWGEVGVRAIVAPPCGHAAGEGDIAILVLERPLVGIPTIRPRLDRAPQPGDGIQPVGFGRCSLSDDPVHRRSRTGGVVDAVREDRFRLNASICPGDSGGPALNADSQLVGVISAAVMDGSEATLGRAEFTRLDHWRRVFENARLISEGVPPAEVPPIEGCSSGPQ